MAAAAASPVVGPVVSGPSSPMANISKALTKVQAQAGTTVYSDEGKHVIWFGILALATLGLLIKDYAVLNQGIDEDKNKTGQAMMISLTSMNFMVWLMFGAMGTRAVIKDHPWLDKLFAITTATYIILWYMQNTWTKSTIVWGKNMSELGKVNFFLTWIFIIPYFYVIYTAFSGPSMTKTHKYVSFMLLVVMLAIPFLVKATNKN